MPVEYVLQLVSGLMLTVVKEFVSAALPFHKVEIQITGPQGQYRNSQQAHACWDPFTIFTKDLKCMFSLCKVKPEHEKKLYTCRRIIYKLQTRRPPAETHTEEFLGCGIIAQPLHLCVAFYLFSFFILFFPLALFYYRKRGCNLFTSTIALTWVVFFFRLLWQNTMCHVLNQATFSKFYFLLFFKWTKNQLWKHTF